MIPTYYRWIKSLDKFGSLDNTNDITGSFFCLYTFLHILGGKFPQKTAYLSQNLCFFPDEPCCHSIKIRKGPKNGAFFGAAGRWFSTRRKVVFHPPAWPMHPACTRLRVPPPCPLPRPQTPRAHPIPPCPRPMWAGSGVQGAYAHWGPAPYGQGGLWASLRARRLRAVPPSAAWPHPQHPCTHGRVGHTRRRKALRGPVSPSCGMVSKRTRHHPSVA